jgi:calcium-dependent protein kinase
VGQFGVTRLATEKATGLKYACKSIPKSNLKSKEAAIIRQELQIMHHVAGGAAAMSDQAAG